MKKVVVITGASSGIGKATALQLIADGHTVYGAARREDKMQDIVKAGGHAIAMDVTVDETVVAGIDQIIKAEGRIDVLVNNAGYAIYGAIEDTTIEDARRQFEVNIFGLARITQLVLPHMRKQKSGTIINISSVGGKIYTPLGGWYHATKHALEGWSDCLRLEVAQFGIDVVIIEPGGIKTEFVDVMHQPMLERSGEGPYGPMAQSVAKLTTEMYDNPKISDPKEIAEVIAEAIQTKKPKTRYAKGYMAKMVLFARKWFSDRAFDKSMLKRLKM